MKRLLLIATMSVAFMSNPLMADGTAVVKVHSHAFTWSFIFQNVQYTLGGDRKFHFQIGNDVIAQPIVTVALNDTEPAKGSATIPCETGLNMATVWTEARYIRSGGPDIIVTSPPTSRTFYLMDGDETENLTLNLPTPDFTWYMSTDMENFVEVDNLNEDWTQYPIYFFWPVRTAQTLPWNELADPVHRDYLSVSVTPDPEPESLQMPSSEEESTLRVRSPKNIKPLVDVVSLGVYRDDDGTMGTILQRKDTGQTKKIPTLILGEGVEMKFDWDSYK